MTGRDHPEWGRSLSVSPDRGTWFLTALYCAFMLAAGVALAIQTVILARDGRGTAPFAVMFGVLAAVALSETVLSVLRRYHRAFWLNGTVLTARRVGEPVRCDLSRASVRLHRGSNGLGGRRLTATGPGTRPITVPLRLNESWNSTSADELRALAQAIAAGREGGGDEAEEVAAELMRLAAEERGAEEPPRPSPS
ncbi:hypothetical protein [Actinomadura rugatobispora]|uniref:PH domain-containing protein n=1 Tax=Actinomadura rugatobispora TaxID=1994 RepID=A0ABW1A7K1_9ACTN|nr:hypothetical protein GCM10010200_045940 [Actinomadura rugatobispora]